MFSRIVLPCYVPQYAVVRPKDLPGKPVAFPHRSDRPRSWNELSGIRSSTGEGEGKWRAKSTGAEDVGREDEAYYDGQRL